MTPLAVGWLPGEIDNLPLFLIVGSASAMIFSMAKAGFGAGLGLLAVPLMIYACGGQTRFALGLMLPLLIAADYVAAIGWWRRWNVPIVLRLIPWAIGGILLAWAAILLIQRSAGTSDAPTRTADAVLKVLVGGIALVFVGLRIVRIARAKELAFKPVTWQTAVAGSTAGFTSTLAHAAGPIATMYLLPQNLGKERFVATSALLFWFVNQLKLAPYLQLGLIRFETLPALVLLLPAIGAGAALGVWLHRRLGPRSFTGIVYVLLAVAGIDLVRKGLTTLLWP